MNRLNDFFEDVLSNTQKILVLANDNNIDIETYLDVGLSEGGDKLLRLIWEESVKKKTNLCLLYSFCRGDNTIKIKINYEDIFENQDTPQVVIDLKNEFGKIIEKMRRFFERLNIYEEEIKKLSLDDLYHTLNKFNENFHSILYSWAYILLRKGIYSDVLICFSLENFGLVEENEILDDIMMELKFTKLDEKDVKVKNSWGKYWKNSIGKIPDTLYCIIGEWYKEKNKKYHAIAVYDYWLNYEKVDPTYTDYLYWRAPYYKELGMLFYEVGRFADAKKALVKYLKEVDPEDITDVDEVITMSTLVEIDNKIAIKAKNKKTKTTKQVRLDYNTQAYTILKKIEQKLRDLIKLVLSKNCKNIKDWFPDEESKRKTYDKTMKLVSERFPQKNQCEIDYDLFLSFTSLNDLRWLINKNSQYFLVLVKEQNWLERLIGCIDHIKDIRNDVAHFREINKCDLNILTYYKNIILTTIKKIKIDNTQK